MPRRPGVEWTPELEAQLRELRLLGLTWDRIADAMTLTRDTILGKARKTGLTELRGRIEQKPIEAAPPGSGRRDRDAYPPGDPRTWGLITAGTVLEGDPYPYPVFVS